ncbi:TetR/AcrR family transcriptional regulator [Promicromonospora sukumoe]|uniref:TetR/AcrR family transcriptional regulator n=1 Tax=Promicromonospora sukumoe TaxID=88382 RepID=UPI0036511E7E
MSTKAEVTPRRRRRQELLSSSIAAARRLLADGGVESVTMLAVSREVGIAGPALYRYFPSRADLLRATHRAVLDELVAHVRAATTRQPAGDRAAALQALTYAMFAWCVAHPQEFDLLLGGDLRLAEADAPVGDDGGNGTFYEVAALTFTALAGQWADGAARFDESVRPELAPELAARRDVLLAAYPDVPPGAPLGLLAAGRVAWQRTFGLLCMTVYDHITEPDGPVRRRYITALLDDLTVRNLALFGLGVSDAAVLDPVFAPASGIGGPEAGEPDAGTPAAGTPDTGGADAGTPEHGPGPAQAGLTGVGRAEPRESAHPAGAHPAGAHPASTLPADGESPGATGRRARLRRALLEESLSSARRLLDEHGPDGVTMQAVAKDVGIAAPGLYRYFDGRPGLLHATHQDVVDELLAAVEDARSRRPADDPSAQCHAVVHAMFRWCLAHRNEYDLLMSGRLRISRPGGAAAEESHGSGPAPLMALGRVGAVFVPIALAWWRAGCRVIPDDELPPALVPHLRAAREAMLGLPDFPPDVPLGLLHAMNLCSARHWGLLTLTVYGHVGDVGAPEAAARLDALVLDLMADVHEIFGRPVSPDVVPVPDIP